MLKLILIIFSFLLGSIPFGYLVAQKKKNIDIRNYGSGNIGATNVARVVGKRWGYLVFVLDFLKGFLVPFFAFFSGKFEPYLIILFGVGAVLGHNWTPFLNFRGGKGVATSLGALFALALPFSSLRLIIPFTLMAWLVVFFVSRIVSLASLLAGFIFFLLALFLAETIEVKILSGVLFIFILVRHWKNIKRIFKRQENKV